MIKLLTRVSPLQSFCITKVVKDCLSGMYQHLMVSGSNDIAWRLSHSVLPGQLLNVIIQLVRLFSSLALN